MKSQDAAQTACKEAVQSSARTLDTIHEIFGDPAKGGDIGAEPALVQQWKNGGVARLKNRLRKGDFKNLPLLRDVDNV